MAVDYQRSMGPQNAPMSVNAQREMGPQKAPVTVDYQRSMGPQKAPMSVNAQREMGPQKAPMSVNAQREMGPQKAPMAVEEQREMGPQKAPVTVEKQREMEPQNAVVNQLGAFATKVVHTPDNAEPAPEHKDQKHVSAYKKKKEKRKKKRLEKAAEELRLKVSEELRLKAAEKQEKIQAMDEAFLQQGGVGNSNFEFRKVLDKQHIDVWKTKLTKEEIASIKAYTADWEKAEGGPYCKTMNSILRKGLYKEGGGDIQIREAATYDDDIVEKSKQNYDAVTDCIKALEKSKLPQDMVCRRGTDLETLLRMLRLNPSDDEATIRENIDKHSEGNEIIFDKGFLSTSAFPNGGFAYQNIKVEWIIQGHKDDEALFIGAKSHFPKEEEVLFQAGTRFRLLKICPPGTGGKIYKGDQQTTWKVYMETVPELKPLRGKNV